MRPEIVGDDRLLLVDNVMVQIQKFNGNPIGLQFAPHVELTVTYTEPGVRGDTATGGATKVGDARDGPRNPRAAVHQGRREGEGPHGNARIRRTGVMMKTRTLLSPSRRCSAAFRRPRADEITLVGPGGVKAAVEKMIPAFEKKTGHKVKATFGSGLGTKRQVATGEPFDVPIVQPPFPEVLASGHVDRDERHAARHRRRGRRGANGRAETGHLDARGHQADAARGEIHFMHSDPAGGAAAGVSFTETLKTLGIAEQMKPKIKLAPGGAAAMAALARGDVEIGLTFISEILTEPGVESVGPLPREISTPTGLVGFVSTPREIAGGSQGAAGVSRLARGCRGATGGRHDAWEVVTVGSRQSAVSSRQSAVGSRSRRG